MQFSNHKNLAHLKAGRFLFRKRNVRIVKQPLQGEANFTVCSYCYWREISMWSGKALYQELA